MSFFSFAEGSAMFDTTPIENLFLMEYLSTAPEACLRVYLYARMLALHPELGGDMAETARFLHMDEEAVYQAFAYWERQGLVKRLSDRPPTYALLPLRGDGDGAQPAMEQSYYTYRDYNASMQALFGKNLMDTHDFRVANDWLDVLGYDQDAALRLVQYGIRTSRSKDPKPRGVFDRMNKLAAAWADRGCRTLEDVEKVIAEQEDVYPVAKAVVKRFALRRDPTVDEVELVKKWVVTWKLTQDQILDACAETTKASKPSFAYLDAVLKNRMDGDDALWGDLTEVLRELDAGQATPTPDQRKKYAELLSEGFEPECVKLAAIQCHRRKKTRFEDVEWMLRRWGAEGIRTRAAAEAYIEAMQARAERVRQVLEQCGLERRPTMGDLTMYEGWQSAHDPALIDYAATCARGMQVPMKYMDRLLEDWKAAGVRTVEEAAARHASARQARAASPQAPAQNPALNYAQREYKEEDYGDDFFVDLDRYADDSTGGGDGK